MLDTKVDTLIHFLYTNKGRHKREEKERKRKKIDSKLKIVSGFFELLRHENQIITSNFFSLSRARLTQKLAEKIQSFLPNGIHS